MGSSEEVLACTPSWSRAPDAAAVSRLRRVLQGCNRSNCCCCSGGGGRCGATNTLHRAAPTTLVAATVAAATATPARQCVFVIGWAGRPLQLARNAPRGNACIGAVLAQAADDAATTGDV
mmetsp:Transcript_43172/g.129587  ORF Transcript_43172/g.129587 Transcript_43172/m.129587 type:complete len:120 (-) Transcript_43172:6-365(-)